MLKLPSIKPTSSAVKEALKTNRRWGYSFDGVDDRGYLLFRGIQVEGDVTFKFYTPDGSKNVGVIVSQNLTGTFASREFQLWTDSNGTRLKLLFGGAGAFDIGIVTPNTQYSLELIGTSFILKDSSGALVNSGTFTRGTLRETTAFTNVSANADNASFTNFFKGRQRDVEIDGVCWPMDEPYHTIQLPKPSGLGVELYTHSVLATPSSKGTQWTHLGDGRWQLNGDGTYNEIIFLAIQPRAYLLEFEIESISGGSIRCHSSATQTSVMTNHIFNTPGKYRFAVTNFIAGAYQSFVRHSGTVTCVIKNISLKPLWVTNVTELITNGNFNSGTSGWGVNGGGTFNVVGGQAQLECVAGQTSRIEQRVTGLQTGAYYLYTADLISATGCNARLNVIRDEDGGYRGMGGQTVNVGSTNAKLQHVFKAPSSSLLFQLSNDAGPTGGTLVWDSVSLRKLDSLCNPLVLSNTTSPGWVSFDPFYTPPNFNLSSILSSQCLSLI